MDVAEETSSDHDEEDIQSGPGGQQKEGEEGYTIAEIQENIHLIYEEYLADKVTLLTLLKDRRKGSTDKSMVSTRAKVYVSYLKMATPGPYWDWRFLKNTQATRFFPAVLAKVGLKPTTVVGSLHNAYCFLGQFAKNLPKNCCLSTKRYKKFSGRCASSPETQDEIEDAPLTERTLRYRFFGYFSAYFVSIYGHRTGVFAKMLQKEVENAVGDEEKGYLVS
ncbi:hypothetical protein WMY93_029875, partial [Mugilogobius chulae]